MVLLGLISFLLIFCAAVLGFWLFASALFLWLILFVFLSAIFLSALSIVFWGMNWSIFLLACGLLLGFLWSVYFFRHRSEPHSVSSEGKNSKRFLVLLTFFIGFLCFFSYFWIFRFPDQTRVVIHEYMLQTQSSGQDGGRSIFL